MPGTVLIERRDSVAHLILNRPAKLNALNTEMMRELAAATRELADDEAIRVVVLRGNGPAFAAGGDVAQFHERRDRFAEEFADLGHGFHESIHNFRNMPKPVLGCVHGAVAGGGLSIMLATDVTIAADNALFTLAYAKIGTSPDGGSTWSLPRIVGMRKALELAFLPDTFDAQAALALGLVNWVVPAAELESRTAALAERLANGPTAAFGRTKLLMNSTWEQPMAAQLDDELKAFAACAAGPDFREGIAAFVEKRKPRFTGK
jgi:2-(1,2-epoxy-1,2-dihydrophenyl)acetyl-CoA isomerase